MTLQIRPNPHSISGGLILAGVRAAVLWPILKYVGNVKGGRLVATSIFAGGALTLTQALITKPVNNRVLPAPGPVSATAIPAGTEQIPFTSMDEQPAVIDV